MNNLFTLLNTSLDTFQNTSINVVPSISDDQGKRYLRPDNNGYQFSQRKMLADIDLAVNSIFKNGRYDREGQRKLYLNIVRFYLNVAIKNTDIDTKNFVLKPADFGTGNIWAVWFLNRQFRNWIKDEGYAATINELCEDFNKYGSCVSKKVGEDIVRVMLTNIICDQSAKTLLEGVRGGIPMVEQHEYSYVEMQDFKDVWTIPDRFTEKRMVYEMYAYIPRCEFIAAKGGDVLIPEKGDIKTQEYNDEMILTMSILMPTGKLEKDKRKKYEQQVLFIEEIDPEDFPYNEAHNEKQDRRWLGVGEVEKQLENQIARNLSANLRRRSMLWASKNIFQTQGDVVAKNLVKDVSDGDVFQVGINGLISKIDTSTRSLGDYSADEQIWEDNSQKQSFAFESATGESFASNTPFRLGALLSNTVMTYFDGKKQKLGLFFQETFYSKLIPIFQKRSKKDLAIISSTEEGYRNIKQLFKESQRNDFFASLALDPNYFNYKRIPTEEEIDIYIDAELTKSPYLFTQIDGPIYKNAKYTMDMNITDEGQNPVDIESLTTVYTGMVQAGDPRAQQVLEVILSQSGKNLKAIAGETPTQTTPVQTNPNSETAQNPNLTGLVPA